WKVAVPTKRCAPSVMATCTMAPAPRRRRTRSAALYAAMPPHTQSRMRRSRSLSPASAMSGNPYVRTRRQLTRTGVPHRLRRTGRCAAMSPSPAAARCHLVQLLVWQPSATPFHRSRPMHIRDWPAGERPREKLLKRGAAVLSDAELLAIFLGSGLRGLDAVATARRLLAEHGPLRRLLDCAPPELAKLPGLGPARACQLSAALELCNRYLAAGLERGEALTDPSAAGRYFAQRLRGHPSEVFAALFLDTRHRALAFEELFRGTVDGAEVHPREVVRRALAHNAAAIIVGH